MSISGITPSANYSSSSVSGTSSQKNNDFKNLAQSLQNGDLSGAQQAYAAIQQNSSSDGSSKNTSSTSSLSTDLQAIGTALQSGDISGAQQALTKLQQDGQATRQAHKGHHHSQPQTTNTSSTDSTQTQPGQSGSTIDVQA